MNIKIRKSGEKLRQTVSAWTLKLRVGFGGGLVRKPTKRESATVTLCRPDDRQGEVKILKSFLHLYSVQSIHC